VENQQGFNGLVHLTRFYLIRSQLLDRFMNKPSGELLMSQADRHFQTSAQGESLPLNLFANKIPLVSIVIPTYNRSEFIVETLQSVYAQTYKDYEIIVVDDGSTDDTVEVIKNKFPEARILQQEHKGGGGAEARNLGIQKARGEYIAFLDSDDIWFPEKLEIQMELLELNPNLMWVYSDAQVFGSFTGDTMYLFSQLNSLHEGDVLERLLLGDFIPFFTLVVRRAIFHEVGSFWATPKGTDWDMCLRIAARFPVGVVRLPLGRYRVHESSVTAKQDGMKAYLARSAIVDRAIARDPKRLSTLLNEARARICIGTGKELARSGNLHQAKKLFQKAIGLTPGAIEAYFYWISCLFGQSVLGSMIKIKHKIRLKKAIL
jgi:glycosyltransferase involved in cell wall biosynthesis